MAENIRVHDKEIAPGRSGLDAADYCTVVQAEENPPKTGLIPTPEVDYVDVAQLAEGLGSR